MAFVQKVLLRLNWLMLSASVLLENGAISQVVEGSEYDSVHSFYTVSVNDTLPRYVLHWTRESSPQGSESPYLDKIEVRKGDDTTLIETIVDPSLGAIHDFHMYDVNGDGYRDIEIESAGLDYSNTISFVIFNKQTGLFETSTDFSGFLSASVDEEKHLVHTVPVDDRFGYERDTYQVGRSSPILIERWREDEHHSTREILKDDSLVIIERSSVKDFGDSVTGWRRQVTSEKLIDNEFRIVKTELMTPVARIPPHSQGDTYRDDVYGTYQYLEEATYTYGIDGNGVKYVDVKKRTVVGGKWVDQASERHLLR